MLTYLTWAVAVEQLLVGPRVCKILGNWLARQDHSLESWEVLRCQCRQERWSGEGGIDCLHVTERVCWVLEHQSTTVAKGAKYLNRHHVETYPKGVSNPCYDFSGSKERNLGSNLTDCVDLAVPATRLGEKSCRLVVNDQQETAIMQCHS